MLLFRSKGSTPLFFPVNITWQIWSSRIVITNTDNVVLLNFWPSSDGDSGLCEDSAVRKVLSNCMNCRKQNARPGEQIMDPLPSARVAPTDPPFTHVGVDYFSSPLFEARTPSGKTLRMFVHMPNHEDSAHGSCTYFGRRLVYLCVSAFCQPQREAHTT